MTTTSYRPTALGGRLHLRVRGSAAPLRQVGNVSVLDESVEEDKQSIPDYTQPGGGEYASYTRIKSLGLKFKLHDLDVANLALVRYGTAAEVAAGTKDAQVATAYQGGLIEFDHPNATSVVVTWGGSAWAATTAYLADALVVASGKLYKCTTAGTSGSTAPTWPASGTVTDGTAVWTYQAAWAPAADTDYEVRPEGLMILEGCIADGHPLSLAYAYGGYSVVEMLTNASAQYEVLFAGLNEFDATEQVNLKYYKVRLGAAKVIAWLGDKPAEIEMEGQVLKDTTITGVGKSQYCKATLV
jgi:hypothetical protein